MNKYLVFESKAQAQQVIPLHKIKKIRIENQELCLAHTPKGFMAFAKNCPHLGEDLSKGKINPFGEVVCPWHSYRFSLASGEECENRWKTLKTYRAEWQGECLYVYWSS
ncbi:Rieske 2Fe-2S domain-containing protein [Reichenbachiella carrageenanivorans]|uniref:Rieske 2Fe-2S domain-containing protein n=1 Tax=Reichenbachiella carrageenanivorans TaxID=2979869 RepID=A0ABY6D5J9_9BACT|nr:Rieske 2Fe-2S domain-containing protein [Reichenbachiella carrageenanivorans]UXX80403.1 Rieske 2Fe-2S domain-containing protein [Reichenbachiella carrageenanivorans]